MEEPPPVVQSNNLGYMPLDEDQQYKAYLEVERLKQENKQKYAEELMQVASRKLSKC